MATAKMDTRAQRACPGLLGKSAKHFPRYERSPRHRRGLRKVIRRRPTLPGGCPPSTIGPGRLNFSVRNGKRCFPAGMTAEIVKGVVKARVSAHLQNSIAETNVF